MKKILFNPKFGLTLAILSASSVAFSQPPPPPATPIDGGLSILLAAVGIYTVKKVVDARKKK